MKDALGHGSNPLGSRIQGVLARGQSQAERFQAHEWMGNGVHQGNAPAELHSGTSKSAPAPERLTDTEMQALRFRLQARGFASIRKD